ncbi:methyltransferase domain-containing protein [Motilibacter aurantiacus]|uniref:methyltransferase domain-containing protein n=1 Tax=Motilibacter aurantiacus TaxID=2714955 RepID=UPI0014086F2D|nr:methyltransferase domain-containing protein [Motilibacter aurantiacus]NHC47047.1 methyltransferase domain-containing protein [Motilibacter aurantiacus]
MSPTTLSAIDLALATPHTGMPADVIPLQYHTNMLTDPHRMDSFAAAIAAVVKPGMRVLDLGAGTGVLSFFAARQGGVVTAVEREPGVLAAARAALGANIGDAVTLVHGDARTYVPSGPVDVVLCEMMHVGQLREKQIEVIGGFKERYAAAGLGPMPRFLPEACVQAAQPVQQDFTYHGYTVAAPYFQDPFTPQPRSIGLAEPQVWQSFLYDGRIPAVCAADLAFTVEQPGRLNAVRMVTKNLLAIEPSTGSSIDWLMNYLVVPLPRPLDVRAGQVVRVRFSYLPGDEIPALMGSVEATLES